MNKFIVLIYIQAAVLGSVFGQNTFQNFYFNPFPNQFLEPIFNVNDIELSDGYLSFFNVQNSFDNSGAFKIDKNGNYLWAKQIFNINEEFVVKSCVKNNNNEIFVAMLNDDETKVSIIKFDISFNMIWEKTFDFDLTGSDRINICSTLDGGIAVINSPSGVIFKINSNGNLVFSKELNPFSGNVSFITNTNDNGFLISESYKLLKTDSLGNVQWSNVYSEIMRKIEVNVSGDIYVLCPQYSAIMKVSSLGSIVWVKNISGSAGPEISDLKTNSSGDVLCSGINSLIGDGFILKLNSLGDTVFSRKIPSNSEMYDVSGLFTDDNGILFKASIYSQIYPDGAILLRKMNENGGLCRYLNDTINLNVSSFNPTVTIANVVSNPIVLNEINETFIVNNYSLTLAPQSDFSPSLCLISVDSTSTQNKVVWEKPNTQAIDSFMVYREFGTGNYGVVGSVPYDSLSQFYDNTVGVNPNITSYRYRISAVDTCGNESQLSDFHETMHLSTNLSPNGDVNLIWDAYEGFPVNYYRILRDSTFSNNWEVLDSVSSNVFIWTDNNPPASGANYVVEVISPFTCTSTKAVDHNSSRSNRGSGISEPGGGDPGQSIVQLENNKVNVFPNPSKDQITIDVKDYNGPINVELYNLQGRLLETRKSSILSLRNFERGVYILRISYEDLKQEVRVVKQ